MMDDKYWPRQFDEIEDNGISLINQPLLPDNVVALPKSRSLHAEALLARLEAVVTVPRDQQREIVRLLYVATRNQVKALAATLELDGLE